MNKAPYIIGICGGSSSGKTLFISKLKSEFTSEQLCVISQDEYYKEKKHQHIDEKGVPNFDLPSAIDIETFQKDLQKLMNGETVHKLEYTFNNPALIPKMLEFKPTPVIVLEGIFIFYFEELYKRLDFSVFIHTKKELQLKRRIKRDAEERGYNLDHVLYTNKHHVKPSYQKLIKPFRHEADVVIPNNERGFEKGLDLIKILIATKLK
ncbi:MAG TPA: uridine kinase [Cytophagaceae bacterium]|jgi:uridine kinase|nr:uridine kinase [Cytophagaceae bacterium]